jgi:NAD(P)-dependent dehydrogenase (short-subunit alcohol dehydrogenase family)
MGEGGRGAEAEVAVVTGAASGIGLALVEGLVGDGASVVMADIDESRLGSEAARLRAQGADVLDVVVDVAEPVSLDDLAQRTFDRFGRVDMLFNNAGTIAFGVVWELELANWDRVLRVNLLSVVHGIRSFVPIMRASGDDGRIVNMASMAAFMQLGGVSPYVATKHAVVGISIALAEDLRQAGSSISVSVVCPGMVATRFGRPDAKIPDDADLPAGSVSAAAAAARILVAAADRHFYIYTHDDSIEVVRDRFDRSLAGFEV